MADKVYLEMAENLKKYVKPTKDKEIISTGNKHEFDKTYENVTGKASGVHYHKSLDFSNVGMPTNYTSNSDATKRLRQFHQTRLYIMDYSGILAHGEMLNTKNNTYLISANLPESFGYQIGSEWKAPLQQFNSDTMNTFVQFGGNNLIRNAGFEGVADNTQSGINRVSTLLTWNGSDRLKLTLDIPVIDDGHPNDSTTGVGLRTNLAEALEFLGSLCLPKGGAGEWGFYQPPPSPFDFSFTHTPAASGNSKTWTLQSPNHARIMLQLGGMLLVDNVIIEKVKVDYPNTKAMIRHWYSNSMQVGNSGMSYLTPLLAKVSISVTTSEALTANTYSNMLWLKQQEDQGSLTANDEKLMKGLYSGLNTLSDSAKNIPVIGDALSSGINAVNGFLNGSNSTENNKLS